MFLNKILRPLVFVVMMYVPMQTMAWGVLGHRIVGEIADTYLTKKAKRNIAGILGNESVAMVSTWSDFIKSDPAYGYMYNWHFINLKEGLSEQDIRNYLVTDTTTDVYTKIIFCTEQLKNKAVQQSLKEIYLKALIHMVGDLHQPMHVGRYEDLGGNKIKVNWFSTPSNLHQVWDEKLISFQELSYTEYAKAINFTTKNERKALQQAPLSDWVIDSYKIAQNLYSDITQPDQRLDYKYNYKYLNTLNSQLLKGGVRLAGLLNEIFG